MYRKRKKMFNISEKNLIKDKPLDPYKHACTHTFPKMQIQKQRTLDMKSFWKDYR